MITQQSMLTYHCEACCKTECHLAGVPPDGEWLVLSLHRLGSQAPVRGLEVCSPRCAHSLVDQLLATGRSLYQLPDPLVGDLPPGEVSDV
jgi:hypothetical protein